MWVCFSAIDSLERFIQKTENIQKAYTKYKESASVLSRALNDSSATLQIISQHKSVYYLILLCVTFYYKILYYILLCYLILLCITLYYIILQYITLYYYTTLHYIALYYVTLH